MLEIIFQKLIDTAVLHFPKWRGLIAAFLVSILFALAVYRLLPEGKLEFDNFLSIVGVLLALMTVFWGFYKWRYPRRSANRLGVVIAIQAEDVEVYKLLQNDFIIPFKSRLHDLDLPFDVLVLKPHQSEWVNSLVDARNVMKKTSAHFCIWGSVKKRKGEKSEDKFIFYLRGLVVHNPIEEVQKIVLRKEFTELLPNTLTIEQTVQFDGFNFRVSQAVTALDYITGRAALLSGDYRIAIQLHESLFHAICNGESFPINIEVLKTLLAIEYDQKAAFEYYNSDVDQCKVSVEKSLSYKRNYGALLKKAIIEFNGGRGDPKKALAIVGEASKLAGGRYDWLYSKAFLHFWLEQYPAAIKACEKLKQKSYSGEASTVQEVVDFNELLLSLVKKPQLYYWLGFVIIAKQNNVALADKYFQLFVESADPTMNDLKKRAESYLAEIKQRIGYKEVLDMEA